MKVWILATTLMFLSACSAVACVVEVHNDQGGSITEYEARLADYDRRGCEVRLSGNVHSSATMFLGATHVCLQPRVTLHFHGPSWGGCKMAPVDFQTWKWRISEHYTPALRLWYRAVIRDHTTIWTVKRNELIRLGVPSC